MASTSIGGEPGPDVNTTTPLPFGDREREPIRGSSETAARIDRYALLRMLGGGGMGVVYAAYDEHLDRKVALKVLSERNTSATAANRMHREAQALARLSHPNVVGVHDVGISEGRVFMAMEFISGQTLRTWLRAESRSHKAILRVFVEAGRGLAAAHAAGIVHRDFKPDNVMVDDDGRVRVFDFGLARPTGSTSEQELDYAAAAAHEALGELAAITATGTILGTPGYMSPEQHMGRPADARSDIYALCVSLYEAFYGQRPFVGETHSKLANAVIRGEYQTPPRGVIPPRMRKIIRRGLDVDPGARWQSMEALLSALTDDPVRRRRKALLIAAGVFTLLTILALAPTVALRIYDRWQSDRHERIAEERWRSTAAQIESIDALADDRQRAAESERIFNTFASAVDHRGTRALTKAWIERGAAARTRGDTAGAYAAYGQAYANANDNELTRQTLLDLAELALTRRDWRALGTLLAELDERLGEAQGEASARLAELRLQHAIATRSASLGDAPPSGVKSEQAALARLVAPLTHGRRLNYRISTANLADTDDDGIDELILVSDDLHAVVVLDRELRLLLRHELPSGLGHALPVPGRPLVLTYGDAHLRLHRVGDRFDELWRTPAQSPPYAAVSGDLSGDRSDDLYVGLAAYRRGLHVLRRPAGEAPHLEVAERSIDASRSDINALAIADLDGDGEQELIAALGPWHAYDLRILRPDGEGLEPVDRVQLGNVASLAVLSDSEERPLLAALKDDRWPNRRVFPAAPHTGEPAGVYLFAFDGEHLLPRGYVDPLADFATPARNFPGDLLVGDFDGDGLDDLVLNANTDESALGRMMIVLRQCEHSFSPARLLGLHAFAVADLDDDPEPELIVRDHSELNSFWAIGLADQPLPPPYTAAPPARLPEGLTDDDLRDGWRRAERMASIGQAEAAAAALQATALRTEPGHQRRATETRAAELYAASGDDSRALALYRADDRHPGSQADVDSAPSLIRLGRYDEAVLALVRADPDLHLPDQLRPADLAHIVDAAPRSVLTFESPLAPSWEILDPLAVRRDPSSDTLRVRAARKTTPIARLPLLWDGGPLVLKAAFAVVHSEFAGALDVSIRGGDGERIAGFWLNTIGGAEVYEHQVGCLTHNRDDGSGLLLAAPSEEIGQRFEHTLTLTIIPSRDASTCRLDTPQPSELHSSLPEALPPGPYTLEIATGGRKDDAGTHITVDFTELELRGATLSAPTSSENEPAATGARLLADGETAAALATLATIVDGPPEHELWRALAHVRRGDLRSSREALATNLELDPRPPAERPDLRRLLRLAEELAPLLREALEGSFTELLLAAWAGTIAQHPGDPYVTRTLIEELERLGVTAEDPRAALLLAARGRAWHHVGEPKRALVDLLAAEAHARDSADKELHAEIEVNLARLHLELADPASAEASLDLALSLSPTPDLLLEILLRDPALAPILEAR